MSPNEHRTKSNILRIIRRVGEEGSEIMCKYCEEKTRIFDREFMSVPIAWCWGKDVTISESEIYNNNWGVFIDRGYLRFAMLDDCQCLEHGDKITLSFCPFCGKEL